MDEGAILASLEGALDPDDPIHAVETFCEARVLSLIWDSGQRLANQAIPSKMQEALPDYEEILDIIPVAGETDNDRRAAVAAKLRGFNGNSMADILAVVKAILGANFVNLRTLPREENIVWWPGGIPGPPGREWFNTAATIIIEANLSGLNQIDAQGKNAKVTTLDAILPVWTNFVVGQPGGFLVGIDLVGIDLL